MRVRKLTPTGDRIFGNSQQDYWVNNPAGVAQLIGTRLRLWVGQWFLFRTDGTPFQTSVLGKFTIATRDPAIQGRILQTDGVLGLKNYSSSLDRNTRAFTVQATADTIYGSTPVVTTFPLNVPVSQGR